MATIPGDEAASPPAAFCVYGRSDAAGDSDPDPRLVTLLRQHGINAYPISQCALWKVVATSEKAYVVGLESLQWWNDAFVKAEGEQSRAMLSGGTWLYTLSRDESGWTVDTVRRHKIY